jgi:hypothetical protein
MAKKVTAPKEPIKIRYKELKNGAKSIYLDVYRNGKRNYEFLKLYLVPETTPLEKKTECRGDGSGYKYQGTKNK